MNIANNFAHWLCHNSFTKTAARRRFYIYHGLQNATSDYAMFYEGRETKIYKAVCSLLHKQIAFERGWLILCRT